MDFCFGAEVAIKVGTHEGTSRRDKFPEEFTRWDYVARTSPF